MIKGDQRGKMKLKAQFVFAKLRLAMLQRNGYHGDGLQRGYLVCPAGLSIFYTPFQRSLLDADQWLQACQSFTSSYLPLDSDVLVVVIFVSAPTL